MSVSESDNKQTEENQKISEKLAEQLGVDSEVAGGLIDEGIASIDGYADEDHVSGNQNNCYWPLHSESFARCKHHMQEKLVYCCTYLENL
jgi:hypothetical protein